MNEYHVFNKTNGIYGFVTIPAVEYKELCKLKGAFDSAQRYVDETEFAHINDVIHILGIDVQKYKDREKEKLDKYRESLEPEGKENA